MVAHVAWNLRASSGDTKGTALVQPVYLILSHGWFTSFPRHSIFPLPASSNPVLSLPNHIQAHQLLLFTNVTGGSASNRDFLRNIVSEGR